MSKEIQDVIEQVMAEAAAVAHLYQETSLFSWEPAQPAPPEPVESKPEPEDEPFEQPALETPEPSQVPDQPSSAAPTADTAVPDLGVGVDSPELVQAPNEDYAPGHKFEQQQEEFPVQPFTQLQSLETFPEAPTPTPTTEAAPQASVPVREESEAPQAQEMPRGGIDTPRIDAEVVEPPMGTAPAGEVFEQRTSEAPSADTVSQASDPAPTAPTVTPESTPEPQAGRFQQSQSKAPQGGVVSRQDESPPQSESVQYTQAPAPESFAFTWQESTEPEIEPLPIPERSQDPEPEFSALISDQADTIARRLEEHLKDGFAKMYGQVALTIDQRMDQLALSMDRRHAR